MTKKELEERGYRTVGNQLFMINREADIWHITKSGDWVPAHLSNKKGCYKVATCRMEGVQHHIYLHRALAEAFLPNPYHRDLVIFKDCTHKEVKLDNLMWATTKIQYEHSMEKRKKYGCSVCGDKDTLSISRKYVCEACKRKKCAAQKLRKKEAALLKVRRELSLVDQEKLTPKEQELYHLRYMGLSVREISQRNGYTRQWGSYLFRVIMAKRKEEGALQSG